MERLRILCDRLRRHDFGTLLSQKESMARLDARCVVVGLVYTGPYVLLGQHANADAVDAGHCPVRSAGMLGDLALARQVS